MKTIIQYILFILIFMPLLLFVIPLGLLASLWRWDMEPLEKSTDGILDITTGILGIS